MWWMDETPYPGPYEEDESPRPGMIVGIDISGMAKPWSSSSAGAPAGVVASVGPDGVIAVQPSTNYGSEWTNFQWHS